MPEGTALPTRHVALSDVRAAAARIAGTVPVSYTHLTLPTIYSV